MEKVITDLRDGQQDFSKDNEAIIEQIKSIFKQQLSKADMYRIISCITSHAHNYSVVTTM